MRRNLFFVPFALISLSVHAMDRARLEARVDDAVKTFGVSGRGVIVAILDRGLDWKNNDFRNADGTTRIVSSCVPLPMSRFPRCHAFNPGWCHDLPAAPGQVQPEQVLQHRPGRVVSPVDVLTTSPEAAHFQRWATHLHRGSGPGRIVRETAG